MNAYVQQFRQFATSQHLSTGLKMTLCVMLPSVILFRYDLLQQYMSLPLGCLCIGLTDAPGPLHYRRNGMFAATAMSVVLVLLAGYSEDYPLLLGAELLLLGFAGGIAGVFGTRINNIALVGLLIFIFHIDGKGLIASPLMQALWFGAGGLLYTLVTLLLWQIKPFFIVQQLLAEHLHTIARYLRSKAGFYNRALSRPELMTVLIAEQVQVHQQQEDLREMIFKTRSLVNEGTARGRYLTMAFLDSIDLFELIMVSQQDYEDLHQDFREDSLLEQVERLIQHQAQALDAIALALPLNQVSEAGKQLEKEMTALTQQFMDLRSQKMDAANLDAFIRLRQVLYALEDMNRRILRLEKTMQYGQQEPGTILQTGKLNLEKFVTGTGFRRKLLMDNFSLQSTHFRHALRISMALIAGYILGDVANLGHAYWILLTIVTILKPSYSITKTRNWHRLLGTLAGAIAGFGSLFLIKDNGILFAIMLLCMLLAYSFIRLQYLVSTFGITVYVILSTAFIDLQMVQLVLWDRLIDTLLGCGIAWLASVALLPLWEHQQMKPLIKHMVQSNADYFRVVSKAFLPKGWELESYKLARKAAMLSLANMSDNFQRMLSEPREQQMIMPFYQQFVNSSHMLTSYIASLAYYAQHSGSEYASPHFEPVIGRVMRQFRLIDQLWDQEVPIEEKELLEQRSRTLFDKIDRLLSIRRASLSREGGTVTPELRKQLSTLKSIADQFLLLETVVKDQRKILLKMKALEEPLRVHH